MNYARMRGRDYCRGYYLVTIVTSPRRNCLSRIVKGKVELSPFGEVVLKAYLQMGAEAPELNLVICAIMPDHFHAVVYFRRPSEHPLGWHIRRFKARATKAIRDLTGDPKLGVFEANFHDAISFDADELSRYVQYVRENPIRWQWKHDHPDFFRKHYSVNHPRLPREVAWTAIGDVSLLDHPRMVAVVVHRRIAEVERQAEVSRYLDLAREGALLIGGFISPGEREVARGLGEIPGAKVIYLLPYGLKNYKPHGRAVKRLAESATLVLSGFPEGVSAAPISYDNCHLNNEWARRIASTCDKSQVVAMAQRRFGDERDSSRAETVAQR